MSLRRVYETTIIVNAALDDADIESVISKVTGFIENHGAEIFEINKWGRRRLAYPINKKYNGYYVHVVFESSPSVIPIFERFLVLEDTILRHLSLVLPAKLRDFRAKRALQAGTTNAPATIESQPKIGKAIAIKEKKAAEIAAKEAKKEAREKDRKERLENKAKAEAEAEEAKADEAKNDDANAEAKKTDEPDVQNDSSKPAEEKAD
jgi:small subunit ribosomal protein S6